MINNTCALTTTSFLLWGKLMCILMSVCSRDTLDKTFKGMRGQAFLFFQSDLVALLTYKPGILSPPAVSFRDCRSFHQN